MNYIKKIYIYPIYPTEMPKKSSDYNVRTGDFFNETDDDQLWVVKHIYLSRNPPTEYCVSMKREDESESTEEEYSLQYVEEFVKKRNQFDREGYGTADVYEIYRMSKAKLKRGMYSLNKKLM